MKGSTIALLVVLCLVGLFIIIGGLMLGLPQYRVWQRGLSGQAQLKEAEWNRQITIREAEAKEQYKKWC